MAKWSVSMNLAGVAARQAGGVKIPTGAYKVLVSDSALNANGNVQFMVQLADGGEFDGVTRKITLGTDKTKEGNKRSWRTLLESVGYDAATLDNQGGIVVTEAQIEGKHSFIFVQNPPEGQQGQDAYADHEFITAQRYQQLKAHPVSQAQGFAVTQLPAGGPTPLANGPSKPLSTPQPSGSLANLLT